MYACPQSVSLNQFSSQQPYIRKESNRNANDTIRFRLVDPWFNFRATKYLVQNGFHSFWDWFDDREYFTPLET